MVDGTRIDDRNDIITRSSFRNLSPGITGKNSREGAPDISNYGVPIEVQRQLGIEDV
ncbi:MAG: hypothetical protein KJ907_03390 [Actinobacteria bacterium]|nr:hypothetical protein [Actinomycetota bacterium]MBU4401766.1 hypothetical protein [Actinomycetota bacterium]MBU4442979.1 hypothetical protein [Actinomycetota bacterium]